MGDIWQARSEGILEGVSLDRRRVSEDGEDAGGAVGLKRKSWSGKAAALGFSKVCVGLCRDSAGKKAWDGVGSPKGPLTEST